VYVAVIAAVFEWQILYTTFEFSVAKEVYEDSKNPVVFECCRIKQRVVRLIQFV
jgi:hypothetical protein